MKLTDEKVAKALGWTVGLAVQNGFKYRWWNPKGEGCNSHPDWTTSLDAITAEIEARGPKCIGWCKDWLMNQMGCPFWSAPDCCLALLAYLKEHP